MNRVKSALVPLRHFPTANVTNESLHRDFAPMLDTVWCPWPSVAENTKCFHESSLIGHQGKSLKWLSFQATYRQVQE